MFRDIRFLENYKIGLLISDIFSFYATVLVYVYSAILACTDSHKVRDKKILKDRKPKKEDSLKKCCTKVHF